MTMANGRCESEPMPCDIAAGSSPSVATSMVIMIGTQPSTAPSIGASSMEWPRTRSWLMYSSMMTPVCTDTPNNARKPTLDDTLMLVCVTSSASNPPTRRQRHVDQDQGAPT